MLGGRLLEWMEDRARRAGVREVRRFVDGLAGTGDRDLGVILGIATVIRVNMEDHGVLPENVFHRDSLPSTKELGILQMRINDIARQFAKRRQVADATGAMVWSYSLRCLNVADLRPLGRAMWAELGRGFPHVEEALANGEKVNGKAFDPRVWSEWNRIPVGLEPEP